MIKSTKHLKCQRRLPETKWTQPHQIRSRKNFKRSSQMKQQLPLASDVIARNQNASSFIVIVLPLVWHAMSSVIAVDVTIIQSQQLAERLSVRL